MSILSGYRYVTGSGNRIPYNHVYVIIIYMNPEIKKIAKEIGEERDIPVEVKKIGNSYYLYKDTTRWDREKKKRVRGSE